MNIAITGTKRTLLRHYSIFFFKTSFPPTGYNSWRAFWCGVVRLSTNVCLHGLCINNILYVIHIVYCIFYIIYCVLYIVYCILYIAYCILYACAWHVISMCMYICLYANAFCTCVHANSLLYVPLPIPACSCALVCVFTWLIPPYVACLCINLYLSPVCFRICICIFVSAFARDICVNGPVVPVYMAVPLSISM